MSSDNIDKRTKEYRAQAQQGSSLINTASYATTLDLLKLESIPCHYVRFHQPVPAGYDKEPVSEFKINSKNKYSVESMSYHPQAGLIFSALNKRGEPEEDITPAANIIYVRV